MQDEALRQIFYHSHATGRFDVGAIVSASKRNNGMDGVTGILFHDGHRFLQVLEGLEHVVLATMERIRRDPRHADVTIISDHAIEERDFAYWNMEYWEPGQPVGDGVWRLKRRLEMFAPDLRHHFFDGEASI